MFQPLISDKQLQFPVALISSAFDAIPSAQIYWKHNRDLTSMIIRRRIVSCNQPYISGSYLMMSCQRSDPI